MNWPGRPADFCAAAAHALRPDGRVYAIYPASRMVEMLSQMRDHRIEPKRLRMVHSRQGDPGVFVLLEGVKGGREGLKTMPPLFVYREAGRLYRRDGGDLHRSLCVSRSRRRLISLDMTLSRISRSSGSATAARLSRIISRSRLRSGAGVEAAVARSAVRRGGGDFADR